MIKTGDRLRVDFTVKVVRGGEIATVRFAELLDRPTVVSVYMKNNTGSCDRQNEALSGVTAELAAAGYQVVAVSRDTAGAHQRYAVKKALPYALVSDPEDQFARATESLVEKSMYGRTFVGPQRAAYVLARDGTVLGVIERVDPAAHAEQLRALLAGLPPVR